MTLIPCPECGKEVSDRAAACPNCGANPKLAANTGAPVKSRRMIVGGVGLLILVVLFARVFSKDSNSASRTASGTSSAPNTSNASIPDDSLPEYYADRIAALYADNEVNADNLFRGQRVKVIGSVTSITRDVMDNPQISFDGGTNPGVVAQLLTAHNVDKLHRGEYVRLRCTGAGKTLGVPYFRDCE